MATTDDKVHAEEVNSVNKDDAEGQRSNSIQHGDRAAQLFGDQKVELTEEDVCVLTQSSCTEHHARQVVLSFSLLILDLTERSHPQEDRQNHPTNPRLGLLSSDPG